MKQRGGNKTGGQQRSNNNRYGTRGGTGSSIGKFHQLIEAIHYLGAEPDLQRKVELAGHIRTNIENASFGSELLDPYRLETLFAHGPDSLTPLVCDVRHAISQLIISIARKLLLARPMGVFAWIFSILHGVAFNHDTKTFVMNVLKEVLDLSAASESLMKQSIGSCVAFILKEMQTFLEVTESQDLVPKALDVYLIISNSYPLPFLVIFQDLVSVLIGWILDWSVSKPIATIVADSLKKFWVAWRERLHFGLKLLANLAHDMEDSVKASTTASSGQNQGAFFGQIRSFLAISQAMCFALFDNYNAAVGPILQANQGFLNGFQVVVLRFFVILKNAQRSIRRSSNPFPVLDVVRQYSHWMGQRFGPVQKVAFDCITEDLALLLEPLDPLSDGDISDNVQDVAQWLDELEKVCAAWHPCHDVSILSFFLEPSGSLLLGHLRLIMMESEVITDKMFEVSKMFCGSVSVTEISRPEHRELSAGLLKEADSILEQLISRYADREESMKAIDDHLVESKISTSAYQNRLLGLDNKKLQKLIFFDVKLLSALAVSSPFYDHELILCRFKEMYFSPNTSNRFSVKSVNWWISLEQLLLQLMFDISKSYVSANAVAKEVLTSLGRDGEQSHPSILLGLLWLHDMVVAHAASDITATCLVYALSTLGQHQDPYYRQICAEMCLKFIGICPSVHQFLSSQIDDDFTVLEFVLRRKDDVVEPVAKVYNQIVTGIDPSLFLVACKRRRVMGVHDKSFYGRVMMCGRATSMRGHIIYLTLRKMGLMKGDSDEVNAVDSIQKSFHATHICRASKLSPYDDTSINQNLDFWSLWETARHFVVSRLKTPLGNPQQTLDSIEMHFKGILAACVEDTTQKRTLLQLVAFLKYLEAQITNAIYGVGDFIAPIPKSSIMFFHTNKNILRQWFTKLTPSVLAACKSLEEDNDYMMWNYAKLHADPANSLNYSLLVNFGQALAEGQDNDSLSGLIAAALDESTTVISGDADRNKRVLQDILGGLRLYATEDYEHAAQLLKGVLTSSGDIWFLEQDTLIDLNQKICFSYLNVDDTNSLQAWIECLQNNVSVEVDKPQGRIDLTEWNTDTERGQNHLLSRLASALSEHVKQKRMLPASETLSSSILLGETKNDWFKFAIAGRRANSLGLMAGSLSNETRDFFLKSFSQPLSETYEKLLQSGEKQHFSLQDSVVLWKVTGISQASPNCQIALAKKARKVGCLQFANRLLSMEAPPNLLDVQYEKAKVEYQLNNLPTAVEEMIRIVQGLPANLAKSDDNLAASKSCRKIATWLQTSNLNAAYSDLYKQINSKVVIGAEQKDSIIFEDRNSATVQLLLRLASERLPLMCKNWLALGHFYYEQCSKMLDSGGREIESDTRDSKMDAIFETILKSAVEAYFRYMQLLSGGTLTLCKGDIMVIMLRILHVLDSHGCHFHETFEKQLALVLHPWLNFLPQLFARLHHPEPSTRQLVCSLICQLCQNYPQAVVFPAVVGLMSKQNQASIYCDEYSKILGTVQPPQLVEQSRRIVEEFERITVLLDEECYVKLGSIQSEAQRSLSQCHTEIQSIKAKENDSIESAKNVAACYKSAMSPVLAQLTSLADLITQKTPVTDHERQWYEKYAERMMTAVKAFSTPSNYDDVKQLWSSCFGEIFSNLSKETQRIRTVNTAEVSPYLASIRGTSLPMPGVAVTETDMILIESFGETIQVLPSKTKPKKVVLKGSNGANYTFLFKGHEDLRLDERVQQLLKAMNEMLLSDKTTRSRNLRARTFSVIPFGDNCGMIQWVDYATQLFSFYKNWKQREDTVKAMTKNNGEHNTRAAHVRLNEVFVAKIQRLLKKNGLSKNLPRRKWPTHIVKEVFSQLLAETPKDIMKNELLCSSLSSDSWWSKTSHFTRSTAVNSIIGYIIGLGDRHLDNILIDQKSGEVIHIDFNVCFEKGLRLRVPETVPFRLTQNFVDAIGVVGMKGSFKIAMELVLSVMRKNKDVLLTILNAFVYDPIIDWVGTKRNQMDNLKNEAAEKVSNEALPNADAVAASDQQLKALKDAEDSSEDQISTGIEQVDLEDHTDHTDPMSEDEHLSQSSMGSNEQDANPVVNAVADLGSPIQSDYPKHLLKRLRAKLEGLDRDSNKPQPISKQVELVMKEAQSIDNLALMYEGWMAWW
ncbi:hypothetical protein HDV05_003388 [Chytridiales sp. JEL 0842]|nr:hypothetical protein HDV05_003388 [Chytridiales sp. JEL 0842]